MPLSSCQSNQHVSATGPCRRYIPTTMHPSASSPSAAVRVVLLAARTLASGRAAANTADSSRCVSAAAATPPRPASPPAPWPPVAAENSRLSNAA